MKSHRSFLSKRISTLGGHFRSLGGGPTGHLSPAESSPFRPYDVLKSSSGGRVGRGTFSGDISQHDAGGRWSDGQTDLARDATEYPDDNPEQRRMRLEAVLLVAKNPLTPRKLAQLAHLADGTETRTLVRQLNQIYDDHGRSVRIERVAGGFRLLTRSAYAPWLARLGHLPQTIRLSSPMMETLAVVAYRQTVSRADVEAVRGVACGELLRQLMDRDLIRIAGRSEELGRPYLYGTTKRFLQLFGLASLDVLPPIQWEPILEDDIDLEKDTDQVSDFQPVDLESQHQDPPTADESSTYTKESVVSTAVASVIPTSDTEDTPTAAQPTDENTESLDPVTNVIEDEEDDLYEGDSEFEDDEEEDEDWDDDYMDDDEEDDLDDDDDDWEEVDDDEDELDDDDLDEDGDDEEDFDELGEDEDEDWDDEDEDEDWDEEDDDDWDDE